MRSVDRNPRCPVSPLPAGTADGSRSVLDADRIKPPPAELDPAFPPVDLGVVLRPVDEERHP